MVSKAGNVSRLGLVKNLIPSIFSIFSKSLILGMCMVVGVGVTVFKSYDLLEKPIRQTISTKREGENRKS